MRNGPGFARYSKHERRAVTLRLLATRGFPPTRAGRQSLTATTPSLRSIRVARDGLRASRKQGGTVERTASPLNFSGVKRFVLPRRRRGGRGAQCAPARSTAYLPHGRTLCAPTERAHGAPLQTTQGGKQYGRRKF